MRSESLSSRHLCLVLNVNLTKDVSVKQQRSWSLLLIKSKTKNHNQQKTASNKTTTMKFTSSMTFLPLALSASALSATAATENTVLCTDHDFVYKESEFVETHTAAGVEFSAPLYKPDGDQYTQVGVYSSILHYFQGEAICMATTMVGANFDQDLNTFKDQAIVQGFCTSVGNVSGNSITGGTGVFSSVTGVLDYQPSTDITGVVLRTCSSGEGDGEEKPSSHLRRA